MRATFETASPSCVDFPGGNAVRITSPLVGNIGLYARLWGTEVWSDERHTRSVTVDQSTSRVGRLPILR